MADNINRMTLVFRGVHDRGGRNAVPILSAAAIRPSGSLTSMCAQTNMDTRLLVLHLKKTHFGASITDRKKVLYIRCRLGNVYLSMFYEGSTVRSSVFVRVRQFVA